MKSLHSSSEREVINKHENGTAADKDCGADVGEEREVCPPVQELWGLLGGRGHCHYQGDV